MNAFNSGLLADVPVQTVAGWFILYTTVLLALLAVTLRVWRNNSRLQKSHSRLAKNLLDTEKELEGTKNNLFRMERITNKCLAKDATGSHAGPGQLMYVPINGKVLTGVLMVSRAHGYAWMVEVPGNWFFDPARAYLKVGVAERVAKEQLEDEEEDESDSGK